MKKDSQYTATDFYGSLTPSSPTSKKRNIPAKITHFVFHIALWCYCRMISLARLCIKQRPLPEGLPLEILLTGTFFSDNWIISLLHPLALSTRCCRIRMVSITPVPTIDKVEPIYPPQLLIKIIGRSPARLVTFFWIGIRTRPHIIGGLHLLINGLMAILLAKFTGARALYSCCGGPSECEHGGINGENHLFCKLQGPDYYIERCLLDAVSHADVVITRGNHAIQFFQRHGIATHFHVVPGGMDGKKFCSSQAPKTFDLILVGNLVPRKRVDLFLEIVSKIHAVHPELRAVVLGDGPLRQALVTQAKELGIQEIVQFAGYQNEVVTWLQQSKIFILPSEAEGLSQAMIQAMLCGLPAVVSQVGEAEELVQDSINGFLIRDLNVDAFVNAILPLLADPKMLTDFSMAARKSSERCDMHFLARKWNGILNELQ